MAKTLVYGFPYESQNDPPGTSIRVEAGPLLAEAVETELQRVEADIQTINDNQSTLNLTAWANYTPTVLNGGSVTWTAQLGRWSRIAAKTVAFDIYLQVNAAGSGSTPIEIALPTVPHRGGMRTIFPGSQGDSPIRGIHALVLVGGTGAWINRLRFDETNGNFGGAQLDAGKIITITGVYEEE